MSCITACTSPTGSSRNVRLHAPFRFNGLDSHGTVAVRTGQNHSNGPFFVAGSRRLEEQVSQWPDKVHQFRLGEREGTITFDRHVVIGRRAIHPTVTQRIAFLGVVDLQMRPFAQDLGHETAVTGVQVLDRDDKGGQPG